MTSGIAVRNVTKTFSHVKALEDVSLDIESGSFCCLVGGSGCGKSTLLNLIAGLIAPTSGTIEVGGRPVDGPGLGRGMAFQAYTLYPWLRVRQNVEFGRRFRACGSASVQRCPTTCWPRWG